MKFVDEKEIRVGVKYPTEYQARRSYEDLLAKGGLIQHLNFEPTRGGITLCLTSEESGLKTWYRDVEFKQEQVNKLLKLFSPKCNLMFVHIFAQSNTWLIAKPQRQKTFIKIERLTFTGGGY